MKMTDEQFIEAVAIICCALLVVLSLANAITSPGWLLRILNSLATVALAIVTWGLWKETQR